MFETIQLKSAVTKFYFCFAMTFIIKVKVAKRQNADLQETVRQLEQERANV